MNKTQTTYPRQTRPELSLIIPCYNEEGSIRNTAVRLVQSFREQGVHLELVLVDNGSIDGTGKVIDQLIAEGNPIIKETVSVNQGYGNGILTALRVCRGNFVGFMCADEPVDSRDVVKLYLLSSRATTLKLFKVRRRFRLDGIGRRVVSSIYNVLARVLFGDLRTMDINAIPKILPREYINRMNLQSRDWFIDAEVMIKAKRMGLDVFELNVFAQMRPEGTSNVRAATCWEFLVNLFKHRFGGLKGHAPALFLEPAEQSAELPNEHYVAQAK